MKIKEENILKSFSEYLNESIEDKGILKSCFFSGLPGAGKTFTRQKITDGQIEPRVINTDKFGVFLNQLRGIDFDGDFEREVLDRAKVLSVSQLVQFINSMLPLYIDGTSANANNLLRRKGILEGFGYDTSMVWIETPLDTAIQRNRERDKSVDEDFLRSVYDKMEENKDFYKSQFGTFVEINNDDGALTDEAILESYKAVSGFYKEDVKNPIGKRLIRDMREEGKKFLVPEFYSMKEIEKQVSIWYQR